MTDHLTRYALVGGPPRNGTAVKNMQLVAVTSTAHSPHEASVRIYCLEDTKAALETVVQSEQAHAGRTVEMPRALSIRDNGGGVCVAADEVSRGWLLRSPRAQDLPFSP